MIEQIFKNQQMSRAKRNKYFSEQFREIYLVKKNNVIKNYVMDPELKVIK